MSAVPEEERLDALRALPWSRELLADEEGRFIAAVPELDGCFADGDTPQAALSALDDVLREWLRIALEEGTALPQPRRLDEPTLSGRFSVRLPRSLHRRLVAAAEREGSSLNQLVNVLLTRALEDPRSGRQSAGTVEDAHEDLAALAARGGPQSIGPLKGIARFVRDRGEVRIACLLYAFASTRIAESEGREAASRELGQAAALARREGSKELAEALLRESVQRDPTNLRSLSALGQLLHHRGRYEEAIECLEPVADVDNHAKLFLGWSRLLAGLQAREKADVTDGTAKVVDALRRWAYGNRERGEQATWLRQVQRLRSLGARFHEPARQLIEFANAEAGWGQLDPGLVDDPWMEEGDDNDLLLASESSSSYDARARRR